MLTHYFREGRVKVVVHAGIEEGIEVRGTAEAGGEVVCNQVVKKHVGKDFVDLSRGQRRVKSQLGEVGANLSRIAPLRFIVARKGVAQLQDGRGIYGDVVPYEEVTPVGSILGLVLIPLVIEGVDPSLEQPVKGEAGEEALLFALVVVHANVESLRGYGVQTWKLKVVQVVARV